MIFLDSDKNDNSGDRIPILPAINITDKAVELSHQAKNAKRFSIFTLSVSRDT
jgi:hypothetical protein